MGLTKGAATGADDAAEAPIETDAHAYYTGEILYREESRTL